ncbi:alpha/beta hydrolase [Aestuariibaculum sp. M13]|uniref:alpha/beta fold hydrolase n=1 Tax=Aestuariibaculum sp. M13 TaxID=2967132 RepID=UPI002159D74F|nr:alpha/beta hydrolase [Aestuariibaculum sp. M13]MCR8666534.1 alpha/beta hydrolase [Aestuariibaculum sp. M13]
MKQVFQTLFLTCISLSLGFMDAQTMMQPNFDTPYGNNTTTGKFAEINGANIYYETYGTGEPLLLIHGCGANIKSMENQIEYFKNKYHVIVADSRGQGKSELKTDSLTYDQMTKDWEGLVRYLKLDSINILGWSDGGIISLKMGINRQANIKKIITMGANLRPDTTAVNSWAPKSVREDLDYVKRMISLNDKSRDWEKFKQLDELVLFQPNISHEELQQIEAAVLVVNGDSDIIKNEHAVEIYQNIPKAQLCIMPGETHYTPGSNPNYFNAIIEKFLSEPFTRPTSEWD